MVGRACALEQARSLGQALRVVLGRRHPRAGQARGRRAVSAGHHRRHARREEGARRPNRRRARECAILEGAFLDLNRRGLAVAPELAVADGALGFSQAIEEVWPQAGWMG